MQERNVTDNAKLDSDAAGRNRGIDGACSNCGRPTAVSRPQCLYCGAIVAKDKQSTLPVPFTTTTTSLSLSEPGFTLFATGTGDVVKTAAILSADEDTIAKLLSRPWLPLARTATRSEADAIAKAFSEADATCKVLGDAEFDLAQPNTRVASIDINESGLTVTNFNTRQPTIVPIDDLVLIVEGTILKLQTDSLSKGRRAATTVSESVTAIDEPVLDLYTSSSGIGFRIVPSGFDFSFLADQKRLTAAENWRTLLEVLAGRLPVARIDREYRQLRRGLDLAWPIDSEAGSTGEVISGLGKRNFGSVSSVSNLRQFNIYSRSRRYFL
jgi:hypothetical protein